MTRVEAARMLGDLFDPLGVPVVADPVTPVVAPAIVLTPGAPYRQRMTACWEQTLDVLLIGGRLDDIGVFDALDELADTFCHLVGKPFTNRGASGAPATRTIGDVDYLAAVFTLTVHDIGPGLQL